MDTGEEFGHTIGGYAIGKNWLGGRRPVPLSVPGKKKKKNAINDIPAKGDRGGSPIRDPRK